MNVSSSYLKQVTEYFRSSVLDSERLSPDRRGLFAAVKAPDYRKIKKEKPFSVESVWWESGQLPGELTDKIFKVIGLGRQVDVVPIVFMPRIELHRVSYRNQIGEQSPIMTPLVVEVILKRDGQLLPSKVAPYVPREFLAPNESDQIPFAELNVLDTFVTLNPYNVENWEELINYCGKMLTALFQSNPVLPDSDYSQAIWNSSIHPDYNLRNDISLIFLEPPIIAGFHIIKVFDALLKGIKPNRLYKRFVAQSDQAKSSFHDLTHSLTHATDHLGQMTDEYPLADKQRHCLHQLQSLSEGEMLAINGPPGTGKTTLLCSVVADLWVKAALEGKKVNRQSLLQLRVTIKQ